MLGADAAEHARRHQKVSHHDVGARELVADQVLFPREGFLEHVERVLRADTAVGRDLLTIPLNEPTTVYGWDLTTPYGSGTALHELGHVIGMEHEHQNPFAGIKWHEQAVYDSLAKPPNSWDHNTTFHNILEKLNPQQVQGSA